MPKQQFNAVERESIWLAHKKKCAYTRAMLDVSNFHIDHIIPETLADDLQKFKSVKEDLALDDDFDIFGWGNLLPVQPSANLQKGSFVFDKARANFFLSIAANKKACIEENIAKVEKRNIRGKTIILLKQCLDRGEIAVEEVSRITEEYSDNPEHIFELIVAMKFADADEVRYIAKADIEKLRDKKIKLGDNKHIEGVTLTNDKDEKRRVCTCRDYESALKNGYYAYSTFDIKMSTWFEQQCGLLKLLEAAKTATKSFISEPKVGVVDLDLIPFSMFPQIGEEYCNHEISATYQSKVDDGTLVVRRVRNNLLIIEEPEGMGQQLIEVLRADFNGDGIEEILMFEYCYATHGTLGFGNICIVGRDAIDGKFFIVTLTD